jgi:hypothetical protein
MLIRTEQSNNNGNQLLSITYLKLQQVKYNKLSKRPIETPLQQSVIVWNFLKKLELEFSSQIQLSPTHADDSNKENSMMDIDNQATLAANLDKIESKTTNPIGFERGTKLLNKLENEQQEQQQKRCKSSSSSYSFYDYCEDKDHYDNNPSTDTVVYQSNDVLNKILTSSPNGSQSFSLWSNSFNYLNKSCSYEHETSNYSHNQGNLNSTTNIEQVVNILIECE